LLPCYPQIQDLYPLTPMQRLFFAMETSQSNLGFEQWHFRIEGAIESSLLRRAIEAVIQRHSILRTAFIAEGGGEPLQVVCRTAMLPWHEEDWRNVTASEQAARIATLLQTDAGIAFDLTQPPAMRIALRRTADTTWHFVWSTHHLCIDGWSWPVVFRDVSRAYALLEKGSEPTFEPAIGYRDYVQWLAESAPHSETFWKQQLDGFTAPTPLSLGLTAAADSTAPTTNAPFAEVVTRLDANLTSALQTLARREQVTPSVVLNAAWSLLLAHYSGANNVVFGAAFSGRPAELHGIEAMVGPCVNNLPVRAAIDPAVTLSAWLAQLQQKQFEIAQHQYAPLEQIQQWAQVPWRYRLFDSLIVFQNYQVDEEARRIGSSAHTVLLASPEATNYALTLTVTMREQMQIRFIHQPNVLSAADVQQFATDIATVLQAMVQSNAPTLADILNPLPQGLRGKSAARLVEQSPPRSTAAYSAPTNEAERTIAAVWQELFGVERVSLDDNFFELGGHSLLLLKAHARLKETLRVDLPIVALLQYPTIRALARHLTQGVTSSPAPQAAIDRAQKQREAQQRRRTLIGRN
jgi:acyl carrier protein